MSETWLRKDWEDIWHTLLFRFAENDNQYVMDFRLLKHIAQGENGPEFSSTGDIAGIDEKLQPENAYWNVDGHINV